MLKGDKRRPVKFPFDEELVLPALGKSGLEWTACIVAAFGLRDEEIRPRIREPLDSISEIL